MCTVATFQPPSRCVCWCVGCVCAACPRSACRRVGVSACRRVFVRGEIGISQYPVFFRKSNYIQRTTTTHKLHFHVV